MVRPRRAPPDGRAANGGRRAGNPGQQYPNRSDMRAQPVATAPGQEYGRAGAQAAAQAVVPLPAASSSPVAQPAPPAAGAAPAGPFATPSDTPNLLDTTGRPDEPLTHGLPFGAGGGPEVVGPPAGDDVSARLRALYLLHPTPDLRELIRQADLAAP